MRFLLCLLILSGITACGKSAEKPPVKLFDTQREALQKASQVGDVLQQAADAQRLEIERRTASEAQ